MTSASITASELRDIILAEDFKTGLEEISSYLASIVQERPIVNLLARCLWKRRPKYVYALERYDRHDLTVNGKHIEVKFNYDSCTLKLAKELERLAHSLAGNPLSAVKGNFGVMPRIWKDIKDKNPHFFVWIICERDLSAIANHDLVRIADSKTLTRYRRKRGYKSDRRFLEIIDGFLQMVQLLRPFTVLSTEIETSGDVPSTYHFRICEFAQA